VAAYRRFAGVAYDEDHRLSGGGGVGGMQPTVPVEIDFQDEYGGMVVFGNDIHPAAAREDIAGDERTRQGREQYGRSKPTVKR
jgi:hypothetical protein